MPLIKSVDEIIDTNSISKPFVKAIEKALFEKSTSIHRVRPITEKKEYLKSKNIINPVKSPTKLLFFTDYLESIKQGIDISIELLHAGLSIKTIVGKKKRNLFSLRHPRSNSDNNIYASLMLNCITDKKDIDRITSLEYHNIAKHENYFKILNITLQEINEIITYDTLQFMITICNRYQLEFKKRNNVK